MYVNIWDSNVILSTTSKNEKEEVSCIGLEVDGLVL